MKRDLNAPVDIEHREVVDLAHMRDGECSREHPLAERRVSSLWLDVHHDVDPGKRLVQSLLDPVGGSVSLADRRTGCDADDDVRETLSPCSPQP